MRVSTILCCFAALAQASIEQGTWEDLWSAGSYKESKTVRVGLGDTPKYHLE